MVFTVEFARLSLQQSPQLAGRRRRSALDSRSHFLTSPQLSSGLCLQPSNCVAL